MKAAVTGGTGFLGSHIVAALAERGDEIRALVRSPARADVLRAAGGRLVLGSLEDEPALRTLAEGADVVFHLAGLVAARSEAEFERVNRGGTERVARAAARAGVPRFVHVSSLAVTGPTVPGRPLDETSGPGPVSAYGRSKRAGEQAVRASGVAFTIVRPPAVYGPRDRAFLPLFRLARRGVVPLLGSGAQELTLVHVADLTAALLAAAAAPAAHGRTYHAGNPVPVTQRALAEAVGRAVGGGVRLLTLPAWVVRSLLGIAGVASRAAGSAPLLDLDKANELLAPAWTCSSEALMRDSDWRAMVPLERGLEETAHSYRKAGWL